MKINKATNKTAKEPAKEPAKALVKNGTEKATEKAAEKATEKATEKTTTNEINRVTIGDKVLKLRKKCKWSQEQLAEYSGISESTIGRIERGDVNPLLENIVKLEKAFDGHTGDKCNLVDAWELERLESMMDPGEALQITANRIARKLDRGLYPDQLNSIERIIDMIVSLTVGDVM